jgi:CheY-like chemotaxis protein
MAAMVTPADERWARWGDESTVRLDGRTILVADDHEETRSVICQLLQAAGARTCEASNWPEALGLFTQMVRGELAVDALLIDATMPGGSLEHALAAVRELPGMPACIVITGAVELELSEVGRATIARCIYKPFPMAELLHALDKVGSRSGTRTLPPSER